MQDVIWSERCSVEWAERGGWGARYLAILCWLAGVGEHGMGKGYHGFAARSGFGERPNYGGTDRLLRRTGIALERSTNKRHSRGPEGVLAGTTICVGNKIEQPQRSVSPSSLGWWASLSNALTPLWARTKTIYTQMDRKKGGKY